MTLAVIMLRQGHHSSTPPDARLSYIVVMTLAVIMLRRGHHSSTPPCARLSYIVVMTLAVIMEWGGHHASCGHHASQESDLLICPVKRKKHVIKMQHAGGMQ